MTLKGVSKEPLGQKGSIITAAVKCMQLKAF